jgi:hypothetical protein
VRLDGTSVEPDELRGDSEADPQPALKALDALTEQIEESSAPFSNPSARDSSSTSAEIRMTGTMHVWTSSRSARNSPTPFRPGIITSASTRFGTRSRAMRSASAPLAAVRTS